jgi:DNA-binding transcriptional regulator PaaX
MEEIKRKILLLLLAGISFSLTWHPGKQWKIIKQLSKEWKKIDDKVLKEEIKKLYRSRLVERKKNPDGSFTFVLTEKGKLKALTYHFQNMKIKKENWDGKWRIVMFDIPEKMKSARDALREKLKELGFYELQKSVFVFPFECKNEIDFVIEFFNLRKFVRFALLESIDNELHLREIFKLET